jgi:hypothetical protein
MPTDLVSVRDARERTISMLSELFAADELDLDEFERRVGLAHTLSTVAEIEGVVKDLRPVPPAAAPAPTPQTALVPIGDVKRKSTIVAVMSAAERKGTWQVAQHMRIVSVMGAADLDFREARLPPGVTEVTIIAVMGAAHIIVPPTLAVEIGGGAILGGFDHVDRAPVQPDPGAPLLRITGFACMGGVDVETRLVGETAGDARRRRRKERKALRNR